MLYSQNVGLACFVSESTDLLADLDGSHVIFMVITSTERQIE